MTDKLELTPEERKKVEEYRASERLNIIKDYLINDQRIDDEEFAEYLHVTDQDVDDEDFDLLLKDLKNATIIIDMKD